MQFIQNSNIFVDLLDIFIGIKVSIMAYYSSLLIWQIETCTEYKYLIIYCNCLLGSLINDATCWPVCARDKLQQLWKGLKWTTVYSQSVLEMFKEKTEHHTQFVITFCSVVEASRISALWGKWLPQIFPKLILMSLNGIEKHC